MPFTRGEYPTPLLRSCAILVLALGLSACAVPGPGEAPDGIYDPNEGANRQAHGFNKRLDSALSGGDGPGVLSKVPAPVSAGIDNMSDTIRLPRTVVNQVLQARLGRAARNTLRFGVNATLGVVGLFDVASHLGMPEDKSDFGETLYVWGLPEGAYMELPVLGPATERDAVGMAVDVFTNPLYYVLSWPEITAALGVRVADKALTRAEYGDSVDALLYGSADSYAQLRTIYLQNRRFELGDETSGGEDYIDPEALDTEGF
ncbi:MAG: MlaA family lipoprotein [Salipiger thiooxidans]|uniref:MlaA family lipoprotein n=1 Tax=Salipiger thiooxidans TaxID=282683 RepID=UPI001CFB1DD4|nr:VacJ family lipoprotein [Salipiger thiooxidans]